MHSCPCFLSASTVSRTARLHAGEAFTKWSYGTVVSGLVHTGTSLYLKCSNRTLTLAAKKPRGRGLGLRHVSFPGLQRLYGQRVQGLEPSLKNHMEYRLT